MTDSAERVMTVVEEMDRLAGDLAPHVTVVRLVGEAWHEHCIGAGVGDAIELRGWCDYDSEAFRVVYCAERMAAACALVGAEAYTDAVVTVLLREMMHGWCDPEWRAELVYETIASTHPDVLRVLLEAGPPVTHGAVGGIVGSDAWVRTAFGDQLDDLG